MFAMGRLQVMADLLQHCRAVLLSDCQLVMQVETMQLEVDAMQAEAVNARAAAEAGQAAVTEVERLAQDNALLAARLAQLDTDLQVPTNIFHRLKYPRTWSRCTELSVKTTVLTPILIIMMAIIVMCETNNHVNSTC